MKIETIIKARDLCNDIEKHERLIEYVLKEQYKINSTSNNSYKNLTIIETLTVNYVINFLIGYKNELSELLDEAKFEPKTKKGIKNTIADCLNLYNKINKINESIKFLEQLNDLSISHDKLQEIFVLITEVLSKDLIVIKLTLKTKELENELIQICE